jgi:DNA ligase D-like protein (predicted 3'-phosphoesterase)
MISSTVRFIIHDHHARKAGYHQDIRFQNPIDLRQWYSFAVPKRVPLKPGTKVLAIRTHIHSEEEALFQGEIPAGEYGGGTLMLFDQGACKIQKLTSAHIVILFQGSKVKGLYHFISIGNVKRGDFKQQHYMLFKSKEKDYEPLRISDTEISKHIEHAKRIHKFLGGKIA